MCVSYRREAESLWEILLNLLTCVWIFGELNIEAYLQAHAWNVHMLSSIFCCCCHNYSGSREILLES